ncbi:hypothetical protein Scep_008567 [Stephania cephalantha]|uniref:BHLH domain-containing protein n=1 Tax=Stephania cephalantha TaxID=152367 RepID=A0AAP0KD45_9MAGN
MHLNASQMGLHQDHQQQQQQQQQQIQNPHQIQTTHFENSTTHDDFLDQMLSSIPNWSSEVLSGNPKSPWDPTTTNKLFNIPIGNETNKPNNNREDPSPETLPSYPYDESVMLASRLRQHQISAGGSPKSMMLQQQLLNMSRGGGGGGLDNSGLFPLPLTLGNGDRSRDDVTSGDGLFNGLAGSMAPRTGQGVNQHFQHPQQPPPQSFGAAPQGMNQGGSGGGGGGAAAAAPVRQKVRARRGQATDPHSIAERLRRERIAERMKALQELVPNANKTDKASMLDEIIDYVKFLQLQVKVLSMSRLGGAAAVAPLVADMSSEGGDCIQVSGGRSGNGAQTTSTNDSLTVTEHQVAKLMEEDMGSAMQYLQGKGLCLMPISLASAISSATCHSRTHAANNTNPLMGASNGGDGPSSPSMSVLTVQSATICNGVTADTNGVKDSTSVSKP